MTGITISPYATTNFSGTFVVSSKGLVQGTASDDPVIRQALCGGTVYSSETYPMYGGIAITELLPAAGFSGTTGATANSGMMGPTIARASTNSTIGTGITGFVVTDQGYNGVITPGSPVPLYAQGGSVNFYRLGSGAKVNVAIDPTLAATLISVGYNAQVSWDFTNQKIIAYDSGIGALAAKLVDIQNGNSKTITYNTSTGLATWSETGSVATILI